MGDVGFYRLPASRGGLRSFIDSVACGLPANEKLNPARDILMPRCLLALGANLGNREESLQNALREISALSQTRLLARSTWHETPAVGGPTGQHDFLNGALLIDTDLAAEKLTSLLQAIETKHGREHKVRWAARTLDIDLLLYGEAVIDTPELVIPHPRMTFRQFVLAPAAEIAGSMLVTNAGWTISALLDHLRTSARYVAIASTDPQIADWLVDQLCQQLKAPRLENFLAISPEINDARSLSAVEWEQHDELRNRLPSHHKKGKQPVTPVVSGYWPQSEHSNSPVDAVHPALVIAVVPARGVSFLERKKNQPLDSKSRIEKEDVEKLLRHVGHGPVARIAADTPEQAIAEALAAISAAWPA